MLSVVRRTASEPLSDKTSDSLVSFSCLLMAFAPVLDPYVIVLGSSEYRLVDLLVFSLVAYLACSKRWSWTRKGLSLVVVAAVFVCCTLISSLSTVVGRNIATALRIALVYVIYSCCYGALSGYVVLNRFARVVTTVAVAATMLLFIQYLAPNSVWDGKLPFALSKTDVFMPIIDVNTGKIRPHAFFQEVSYYSLYVAPALMFAMQKERFGVALFLAAGLALSSSLIGYVTLGIALCLAISRIRDNAGHVDWAKIALVVSSLFYLSLGLLILVQLNVAPLLNSVVDEISFRINSVFSIGNTYSWGRSSAQLRLLGNIDLFQFYEPIQKMFGMGVGEYANVFSGVETTYSSSMVNMLLGFGIVGIAVLTIWFFSIARYAGSRLRDFPILVVLAMFTDNVLFGWYFFYLLSWVDESPNYSSAE